jgi:hypothetical protein
MVLHGNFKYDFEEQFNLPLACLFPISTYTGTQWTVCDVAVGNLKRGNDPMTGKFGLFLFKVRGLLDEVCRCGCL